MYHLSDDNLDKLFGSLKDLEREPDAALWSDISSQLPGKGFFNWGAKHFNVYYASVGIVALLIGSFLAVNTSSKQTGQRRSLVKVRKIEVQNTIVDPIVAEPIVAPEKITKQNPAPKPNDLLVPMPVEVKDTIAPEPIVEVKKVDSLPAEVKAKKIVKIIRRDTLRVQDTVRVKRRSNKIIQYNQYR